MTHEKYHTEAIVLHSAPTEEASKFLYLLTKDFGLIHAYVRGVRKHASKLRYSLQDFSYTDVDLVWSARGFKVTSALLVSSLATGADVSRREYIRALLRIASLLRRLMKGSEKNETLFLYVRDGLLFAKQNIFTEWEFFNFEALLVMRILHALGYWGDKPYNARFLDHSISISDLLKEVSKEKSVMIASINESLKATHL